MRRTSSWPRGARALVTGASGGIGAAISTSLVQAGANVVLSGRDEAALGKLAAKLGCPYILNDLGEPDGPQELVRKAVETLGGLDVLVSNAGIGWAGYFVDMQRDDIERVIQVDLLAPLLLAHESIPYLHQSPRSSIVFISSIAGHLGVPGEAVYSSAKAGLIAAAEALAQENAGHGMHVGVVSPGPVRTSFFANHGTSLGSSFPKQLSPMAVARAAVRVVEGKRNEVILPRWLRAAVVVRSLSPGYYRIAASKRTVGGLAVPPGAPN